MTLREKLDVLHEEITLLKCEADCLKHYLFAMWSTVVFLLLVAAFAGRAIYVQEVRREQLENRLEQYEVLVNNLYGENGG